MSIPDRKRHGKSGKLIFFDSCLLAIDEKLKQSWQTCHEGVNCRSFGYENNSKVWVSRIDDRNASQIPNLKCV